jgi:hypothetical protein
MTTAVRGVAVGAVVGVGGLVGSDGGGGVAVSWLLDPHDVTETARTMPSAMTATEFHVFFLYTIPSKPFY